MKTQEQTKLMKIPLVGLFLYKKSVQTESMTP
jgi:hypothetical protein